MINRLQPAIEAANAQHQSGASLLDVIAAARNCLAATGEFGKSLDRSTRRVVRQVTGIDLEPGDGSGSIRPDGTISYRSAK